tara:strand:+ start:94 stop:324 length:231 start_codon:yes stop_codon:yes gene_type:complete
MRRIYRGSFTDVWTGDKKPTVTVMSVAEDNSHYEIYIQGKGVTVFEGADAWRRASVFVSDHNWDAETAILREALYG